MVNFMYEETNRFLSHRDQEENFDRLFGTSDWRPLIQIKGAKERRQAIHVRISRIVSASSAAS
jgi:hypothetical protein